MNLDVPHLEADHAHLADHSLVAHGPEIELVRGQIGMIEEIEVTGDTEGEEEELSLQEVGLLR